MVYEYNFSEGVCFRGHRLENEHKIHHSHKLVHCKKSNHICYAEIQIYYAGRMVLQSCKTGISGILLGVYDIGQNANMVVNGIWNSGSRPITKLAYILQRGFGDITTLEIVNISFPVNISSRKIYLRAPSVRLSVRPFFVHPWALVIAYL